MTLKANRVTWLRRTALPQGSQGPDGTYPPAPHHRLELRAATARSDFGVRRARDDPRVIVSARRLLLRRLVGGF